MIYLMYWLFHFECGVCILHVTVGCLKITKRQVIKKRSPKLQTQGHLSITAAPRREGRNPHLSITAAPRREGRNPHLSITEAPRREGRNPRLSITAAPRREGRNPRLSYNCPRYGANHCPHNEEVNSHYGAFLGGTFTPETSINSPVAMEKGGRF